MLSGRMWILPRLPCRGDKGVCGWQAERFLFHAKNPYRKFEQSARSEIVSKQKNACNIGLRRTFYDFFKTISGDEVEKLRIYGIVIHRSGLSC